MFLRKLIFINVFAFCFTAFADLTTSQASFLSAASEGRLNEVRAYIKSNGNINVTNSTNDTALILSIASSGKNRQSLGVSLSLIISGANPNFKK